MGGKLIILIGWHGFRMCEHCHHQQKRSATMTKTSPVFQHSPRELRSLFPTKLYESHWLKLAQLGGFRWFSANVGIIVIQYMQLQFDSILPRFQLGFFVWFANLCFTRLFIPKFKKISKKSSFQMVVAFYMELSYWNRIQGPKMEINWTKPGMQQE